MSETAIEKRCPSAWAIWAGMFSIYIVWGSTYLAIRFAIETMPPFWMASVRFFIAGLILFIWRRAAGDPLPTPRQWRSAAIIGLLLLVGGNGGVVWAEQRVASGVAALLVGSTPLWIVLIDALLPGRARRERPRALTIGGVLLGFAGVALLVSPAELTGLGEGVDLLGAAVLTLAAFFWAVGSLYSRGADLPESPPLGTGMEMLAGGLGLLVLGSLAGEWSQVHIDQISTRSLLGLLYLIFFGSLVGFGAYTWLLRVAPTNLVSTYAYVNPLVAILLGNLLAGEPLTARILLATAITLTGVALITATQPARRKPADLTVPAPCSGDD